MSSSVFEAWGNSQQSCSAQNASDSSFKPQILAAIKEVSPAYRWPIGLIIVFTSTFVVFNLLQHLKNPLRDVPGPWMAKFSRLWLMRAYASRSFQQINRDLHRKHGAIVRIAPNEYSIDDPDAAQVLYRTQNALAKSPRYLAWGVPTDEQNIFSTTDASRHAFRRRQTAKLYQWNTLNNFEPSLDLLTEQIINKFNAFARTGEAVELNNWCHYYTLDSLGMITLGRPFGFLEKGTDVSGLMGATQFFARYGTVVGVYPEIHPTIYRILSAFAPKGAHGLGYLVKIMNEAIEDLTKSGVEQEKSKQKPNDFERQNNVVSMMYQTHLADPQGFTLDDIRFHIVPLIGGGSDTTGATLSAVFYNLIRHPSALFRLRQELEDKERRGKLSHPATYEEVMNCPYLQAVIKETMRVFPGVGLTMPRAVPEEGIMLAGRMFPAGSLIGVNPWVAHLNPTVFGPDAHVFRPERWLDASAEHVADMDRYFMTFGKGPRTCLGKSIPLLEIGKVVPEIVSRFDFEMLQGPAAECEVVNDWFVRQDGFKVKVTSRVKGQK